ncbi:uncharacterized protein LOC143367084 [Andrena cerasifolii]|uniref:uncharacterized protein LOC143367084 n=1 Tax=Andrena cerasifolii TaxID=2819439 RepID=UPI00403790C1
MIRTFIFFDLETTGLIKNNAMPKITEMSLIAVSRNNIHNGMDSLPRVLHKLILPIHPDRNISKQIKDITGLSNENLNEAESFNGEIYALVTNFIKRLKAPTCFVAHNGNQFDYPVFLWELQNIDKVLSKDILSIDMLHLVEAFFSGEKNPIKQTNDAQGINCISRVTEDINNLLNDGNDEMLSDALDSAMNYSSLNSCDKNETAAREHHNTVLDTPRTSCSKSMQDINEKTPESQKILESRYHSANFRNKKESCSRKKLNFTPDKPANFKLPTIYKHLFRKCPENAHSAEGDCLSMIRCAIQFGDFFVEWAEQNAVPLISHTKKQ